MTPGVHRGKLSFIRIIRNRERSSMKVVFVIPPFDYAWSIGSPYRRARNGILPPLGVGFLAAALVDAMAERFNIGQAAEAVAALNIPLCDFKTACF